MDTPVKRLGTLAAAGDAAGVAAAFAELKASIGLEAAIREAMSCDFGARGSKSPVHSAATRGRAEVLRVLLQSRVDPNALDDGGNTPLHLAADLGHARAVQVMLEGGADKTVRNNFGKTPVDKAQSSEWDPSKMAEGKALVRRLLDGEQVPWASLPEEPPVTPVSPSPAPSAGVTAGVHPAVHASRISAPKGDISPMPRLSCAISEVSTAATVQDLDSSGRRLSLMSFVRRGDAPAVELWLHELLAKEGEEAVIREVTNTEEDDQDTRLVISPLHAAAAAGHASVLRVLLAARANPDIRNDAGNTPLHMAADLGHEEAVGLLLELRADPMARNNFGRSALDQTKLQEWESKLGGAGKA